MADKKKKGFLDRVRALHTETLKRQEALKVAQEKVTKKKEAVAGVLKKMKRKKPAKKADTGKDFWFKPWLPW